MKLEAGSRVKHGKQAGRQQQQRMRIRSCITIKMIMVCGCSCGVDYINYILRTMNIRPNKEKTPLSNIYTLFGKLYNITHNCMNICEINYLLFFVFLLFVQSILVSSREECFRFGFRYFSFFLSHSLSFFWCDFD